MTNLRRPTFDSNPYAPSECDDGKFGPESPYPFWFTVGGVACFCFILTLVSQQTFFYGVEGLLVLVLSIGRVPMMRQKGSSKLLVSSSALLLLSSLFVVALVVIATLIAFFAIFGAVSGGSNVPGPDRMWGMLCGGAAAMIAFVYFYQQSKLLPF